MTKAILKWTSANLLDLQENGNRYEIIDGDLFVTRAPHWRHQEVCGKLYTLLDLWSDSSQLAVPEASRRAKARFIFGAKRHGVMDRRLEKKTD